MIRPRYLRLVVALFVMALFVAPATAQKRGPEGVRKKPNYQGGRPEVPKQQIRAAGTIQGIKGNVLHVVGEEGGQWLVKLPDNVQHVTVSGSALASWLQRGMWVRFYGTFDKKGAAQQPIQELFVFSPGQPGQERNAELYTVGIFPEGAATAGLKGVFDDEGDRKPAPEVADYRVIGRLTGFSGGMLSVSAGRGGVKAPLAEDARISVSISDLRSIRIGDNVEVNGWHLPNQKTHIFAERLTVKPAVPLGTPIEKPAAEKNREEGRVAVARLSGMFIRGRCCQPRRCGSERSGDMPLAPRMTNESGARLLLSFMLV